MRRLHAVAPHEHFLASGRYVQYSDEIATGVLEYWSMHEVGGAVFIRVDHDGRAADGISLLMEALRRPDGQLERVDLHRYEAGQSHARRFSADFYEKHVEMTGVGGGMQRFALPPQAGVWLGSWLLLGLALMPETVRLLQWNGEGFKELDVRYQGSDSQTAAGRDFAARRYMLGDNVTLWLDEATVALHIVDGSSDVRLSQYARRV